MARRPRTEPPPHPLIDFVQPVPAAGERLIRVVLDPSSKRWGFFETPSAVVVEDDAGDVPDVPADLEYPFNEQIEALHEAMKIRASAGHLWRIVSDGSGRWGFHEV